MQCQLRILPKETYLSLYYIIMQDAMLIIFVETTLSQRSSSKHYIYILYCLDAVNRKIDFPKSHCQCVKFLCRCESRAKKGQGTKVELEWSLQLRCRPKYP